MKPLQKFNLDHLKILCSRGVSMMIVFILAINLIHSGIVILNGITTPFEDSKFADTILSQRLLTFTIIVIALVFQAIHAIKLRGGLISKIVIAILLVSFASNLNMQYTAKRLVADDSRVTQLEQQQQCLLNSKLLWPKLSFELYEEASKMNCTGSCPCTSESNNPSNKDVNFQQCLTSPLSNDNAQRGNIQNTTGEKVLEDMQSGSSNAQFDQQEIQYSSNTESINIEQKHQRLLTISKLAEIEEALQCSGICESQQSYFFWDINQQTQPNTSCYSVAVNFIQKDVLQPTKNQSLIILLTIFFTLIQEIIIYKSSVIIFFAKSKLGACFCLPISRVSNFSELNELQKECDKPNEKIKIQLIDLTKKLKPPQQKDQKCVLELKVSPNLLKTDGELQSPEQNDNLSPQCLNKDKQISIPGEQNC